MLRGRFKPMLKSVFESLPGGLALLLGLAAWLRWDGLLEPSLNWDEANTLAQAMLPVGEMIVINLKRDISLPGMPFLLHWWLPVAGNSDNAIRVFAYGMGLLGVVGAYVLAWQLSRSKTTAFLTGLFVLLSPFLLHYSRLVTKHSVYCTLILWSWFFLLRLTERVMNAPLVPAPFCSLRPEISGKLPGALQSFVKDLRGAGLALGYGATTFLAIHMQPIGPIFWLFQPVYLWLRRNKLPPSASGGLLGYSLLLGLTFLPDLWALLQPWHPVHLPEIKMGYTHTDLPVLLWTYPNLLLSGQDRWPDWSVWRYGIYWLLGALLLWRGLTLLHQTQPRTYQTLWMIAGWPLLLLGVAAWVGDFGFYQFRAILFGVFFIAFIAAFWINAMRRQRHRLWWLLLVLILVVQGVTWQQKAANFQEDPYRAMAQMLQRHFQPGDGLVVVQGFHYLPLLRYLTPERFGITAEERAFNPVEESIYNMVNHEGPDWFFVSGVKTMSRPNVIARYQAFQARHQRLWFVGEVAFMPFFECDKSYITYGQPDGPTEHRCKHPGDYPDLNRTPPTPFCHRKLAPVSQWECDPG